MTIKEKLKELLIANKDLLQDGAPLQIRHSGTSPAYIKLISYAIAEELGLAVKVSIKDTYVEISLRETNKVQITLISQTPEKGKLIIENDLDLDLEEVFG